MIKYKLFLVVICMDISSINNYYNLHKDNVQYNELYNSYNDLNEEITLYENANNNYNILINDSNSLLDQINNLESKKEKLNYNIKNLKEILIN